MPPAAKHFDPVLGIDVHIIQPPPPAPPLPIPHPHTGIVFDPFDYAPVVGGTVEVGGLQRAQAGSGTIMIPSHIPIGGTFVKPPGNEGEVFMGSSTVACDGDAFTYLALPVITCQDIGIPAPGRPKGSPPKSLVLPTAVVLSIPLPVSVGGGPTISLMALGMRAGLAALGKGLKKLSKLDGVASRVKKFSDALHGKAGKAMDALGIPPNIQRKVHDGICSVTGHPVDVASGKVFTVANDFALHSPIPLRLHRRWYSSSTHRGDFGHGWHHPLEMMLFTHGDVVIARIADGRHVAFPALAEGETIVHLQERLRLGRDRHGYWLRDADHFTYRFDGRAAARLVTVNDDAGRRMVVMRDTAGRLEGIIDCAKRHVRVETDAQGRVVHVLAPHPDDARRHVTVGRWAYDDQGDLVRHEDALGRATHYAYRTHLLVTETHPGGLAFHFEYDGPTTGARCIKTWGTGGIYARSIRYDDDARATTVVDSLGHATIYRHDGAVVHEIVDPCGGVTKSVFDEHYRIVASTDPLRRTTRYRYDDDGNMVGIDSPDGTSIAGEYDARGRQTRFVNQRGVYSTRRYDDAGRLVERRDPLGDGIDIRYDGLHESIRTTDGAVTVVERDAAFNVVKLCLPDGNIVRWERDAWGRVLRATSPTGAFEQRSYDLLGRTVRIHGLEGDRTDFEYDASGEPVRIRHGNRETRLVHGGLGRLRSRTEAGVTLAFQYDTEERLLAIVDGNGGVRRFEYDANGRIVRRIDPSGRATASIRDAAGRVVRVERPDGTSTTTEYDDADQVVAREASDGTRHAFKYRADGALIEAANATTTVSFDHDDLGRVVRESRDGLWVASGHGVRGRVAVASSLGAKQEISRNLMGDVVSLRDGGFAAELTYDQYGWESARLLPGGIRTTRRRDPFGREVEQTILRDDTVLRTRVTHWGREDRIERVDDSERGSTSHGHDLLGSLAWTRHPTGEVTLRMPDAVANLFRTEDRSDRAYGPSGELLWAQTAAGRTVYTYDAQGRLASRQDPDGGRWTFAWDGLGSLIGVTRPDGEEVRFAYDAIGRRVAKTFAGNTLRTLWDRGAPLHEWTTTSEGAAGPITDWIFEPGTLSPMGKRVGTETFAIVCDRLGTPQVMFDDAGRAVWSADVDTYGKLHRLEGRADDVPFRWPGQREDPETGLHYNRYRYYDPTAGVYISPDPLAELGGLRAYGYVGDTLIGLDPFGLENENKAIGDLAEKQAKKDLEKQGYTVHGPMENKSGNGVDLVVTNPKGDVEVVEVKANDSKLNPDQKNGADWFAQDRADKCISDEGNWASKKPHADARADMILDQIDKKGGINGWVLYYDVKDGKATLRKCDPWVKCS
jgi:RHS repeat-associated protein